MSKTHANLSAVALLNDPIRRALYEWVVESGDAVSRDDAAAAIAISRGLAAFHLDRLVRAGLLAAEYRRLSGRTGPGAGRPSKLYRRGTTEVAVSLPDRHYEVAAGLFAETIDRLGKRVPPDALRTPARELGERVGAAARRLAGPRPSRARLRAALVVTLRERGYLPRDTKGEIRLRNCPFDVLVDDHRELVCGMNLGLAEGLLSGLGDPSLRARQDPQPGQCCVAIGRAVPEAAAGAASAG